MSKEMSELGKKSSQMFIGNILGTVLSTLFVILVGKILGAKVFGQFIYISSFLAFFTIIPKLGMDEGIISFLSNKSNSNNQKKSLVTFALLVTFILSFIIVIVSFLKVDYISKNLLNNKDYHDLFLILLPTVIFISLITILKGVLRSYRKVKEIIIVNLLNPIIKILLVIFFVLVIEMKNYYSLVIPLYVYLLVSVVYFLINIKEMKLIGKISFGFDNKKLILFSLPLLFGGVVNIITQNVDQFMIGYIVGAKEVGIYKIALLFGTLSSFALVAVNTVFASMVSNLYNENRIEDLKKMFKITTKWITIINLMIFGMVLLFSKELMKIVGDEFIVGSTALIFVCAGQVINSIVGSVGLINIMTGKPKYDFLSSVIAMIVNALLNIVLIRNWGINGAAIATAIALLLKNIINFYLMYRNLKIHPYNQSFMKILLTLVITISITFILSNFIFLDSIIRLVIWGSLYFFIFIYLIYKFAMEKIELDMLRNIFLKNIIKKI